MGLKFKWRKGLFITTLLAFLLISHEDMLAQRTAVGQSFVSGHLSHDFTSLKSFGGGVSYGQYLLDSYWKASASIDNRITGLSTGDSMEYTHIYVAGDWMYRCANTSSRSLSFYLGAGLFLGYEAYDLPGKLPSNIDTGLGSGTFLYGLRANLELEYFVAKAIALTAGASLPIHFGSPTGWLKWSTSIGIRYNF